MKTWSELCVLLLLLLQGLRDIALASPTCDRVVTRFSNPKREAGTYLRAARAPMATTEVWCHRSAEHVFTRHCLFKCDIHFEFYYSLTAVTFVSRPLGRGRWRWRAHPPIHPSVPILWQVNDYGQGNLPRLHKNCDYSWLVCQKILLSKA